jgi:hypothetical protein
MDTEVLVENKLEDGRRLLWELGRQEFPVEVAFWAKRSEDSLWQLFLASPLAEGASLSEAYNSVYSAIDAISNSEVQPSDIRLISSRDEVAKDAVALRNSRIHQREANHYQKRDLGRQSFVELVVYPEPQPMPVREYEGTWQVLISVQDDNWLSCDSEEDARAISIVPVLKYEALQEIKCDPDFADELEKSADALARYRMSFGARFLKRRADEIRKKLGVTSP